MPTITLADLIKSKAPLTEGQYLKIVSGCCEKLDRIHDLGIAPTDEELSPENIQIEYEGSALKSHFVVKLPITNAGKRAKWGAVAEELQVEFHLLSEEERTEKITSVIRDRIKKEINHDHQILKEILKNVQPKEIASQANLLKERYQEEQAKIAQDIALNDTDKAKIESDIQKVNDEVKAAKKKQEQEQEPIDKRIASILSKIPVVEEQLEKILAKKKKLGVIKEEEAWEWLKENNKKMSDERSALQSEYIKIEKELASQELTSLPHETKEIESLKKQVEAELKKAQEALNSALEKYPRIKSPEALENAIEECQAELKATARDIDDPAFLREEYEGEIEKRSKEIIKTKQTLNREETKLTGLQQKIKRIGEDPDKGKIIKLIQQEERCKAKCETLKKDLEKFHDQSIEESAKEIIKTKQALNREETKLTGLQQKVKAIGEHPDKDNIIKLARQEASCKATCETLKRDLEKLQDQSDEFHKKIESLKKEMAPGEKLIEMAKEQIKDLKYIQSLQAEISSLKAKQNSLGRKDELQKNKDKVFSEIKSISDEITTMQKEFMVEPKKRFGRLGKAVSDRVKKLLESRLENEERAAREAPEKLQKELKLANADKEKAKDKAALDVSKIQKPLADLQENLSTIQARGEKLNAQLQASQQEEEIVTGLPVLMKKERWSGTDFSKVREISDKNLERFQNIELNHLLKDSNILQQYWNKKGGNVGEKQFAEVYQLAKIFEGLADDRETHPITKAKQAYVRLDQAAQFGLVHQTGFGKLSGFQTSTLTKLCNEYMSALEKTFPEVELRSNFHKSSDKFDQKAYKKMLNQAARLEPAKATDEDLNKLRVQLERDRKKPPVVSPPAKAQSEPSVAEAVSVAHPHQREVARDELKRADADRKEELAEARQRTEEARQRVKESDKLAKDARPGTIHKIKRKFFPSKAVHEERQERSDKVTEEIASKHGIKRKPPTTPKP